MISLRVSINTYLLFMKRKQNAGKNSKMQRSWHGDCFSIDICVNLIDYLKKILSSQHFVNQHKNALKDFTRSGKLPFQILVLFLINLIKESYQDELDHFFKAWLKLEVAFHFVSKMALSKARMKLKYSAFVELNQHLVEYFYVHFKAVVSS